jgi:hypothetical protein
MFIAHTISTYQSAFKMGCPVAYAVFAFEVASSVAVILLIGFSLKVSYQ